MVKYVTVALVVLVLGAGSLAGAEPARAADPTAFVSVIDDLPLMDGLDEVGEGVEFTTGQGRIVEATATARDGADLTQDAVMDFYAATLPQLGWRKTGGATFSREGEVLELLFGTSAGRLTVRFSLAPADR